MEKYCFLNGRIVPTKKAQVSVTDIGLLRGFGVFDYLRTFGSKPFLIDEHLKRFENSAKKIGLRVPYSKKKIRDIIEKLILKNNASNVGIRIVLTGGESADGLTWDEKHPNFFILMKKLPDKDMKMYDTGVKLMTHDYQRETPEAKTNNYVTSLSLSRKKNEAKAHEVLFVSGNEIREGATCNIFIFKGNILITNKRNILMGTRRSLVLKLAKGNFITEEKPFTLNDLLDADEIFITSTTRDILPVTNIDGQQIGNGKVGKNTKILMELFDKFVTEESSR